MIDAAGDLVEVTNPRELALGSGKSTRYTYYTGIGQENLDHNLRCLILPESERDIGDVEQLCGPAGQGHTWTHFVNYANDTAYEQTSSLGEVTRLYYDFFRRRPEVVFPDGAKEAYIFDRVGNIIRRTRTARATGRTSWTAWGGPRRPRQRDASRVRHPRAPGARGRRGGPEARCV